MSNSSKNVLVVESRRGTSQWISAIGFENACKAGKWSCVHIDRVLAMGQKDPTVEHVVKSVPIRGYPFWIFENYHKEPKFEYSWSAKEVCERIVGTPPFEERKVQSVKVSELPPDLQERVKNLKHEHAKIREVFQAKRPTMQDLIDEGRRFWPQGAHYAVYRIDTAFKGHPESPGEDWMGALPHEHVTDEVVEMVSNGEMEVVDDDGADVVLCGKVSPAITAHEFCSDNKSSIFASKRCGCFYCGKTCEPSHVKEWVDKKGKTALCPHCGIDSLLGDADVSFDETLLKEMHKIWFRD